MGFLFKSKKRAPVVVPFPGLAPVVPPQPPVPQAGVWAIGPIVNGQSVSKQMPPFMADRGDGTYEFNFPVGDGVHGVTRPGFSPPAGRITIRYRVEGEGELAPTGAGDQPPAQLRLFLQRAGDDWGGEATGKASWRFYSGPMPLDDGDHAYSVDLTPELWTNIYGQNDAVGFMAALANLGSVGMGFGGAFFAMHGAGMIGPGSKKFILLEYSVS